MNIEESLAAREQPVVTGCEWSTDGEIDMWETTCGKAFVFNEDGPIANGFEFCPFCGLSLDEPKNT